MTTRLLTELLNEALNRYSDRQAVWGEGLQLTYGTLAELADCWAAGVAHQGVCRGDAVVSLTGNSPWSVVALMGILKCGACEVALQPAEPLARIRTILDEVQPRLIIVSDPQLKERLMDHGVVCGVLTVGSDPALPTEPRADIVPMARQASPDDAALIQYTSGSTGGPKGAVLSQGALAAVLGSAGYFNDISGKRLTLGIPLAHAYGKTCVLEYLLAGGHLMIEGGFFLPAHVTQLLKSHHSQAVEGPPALYEMACTHDAFHTGELPALDYIAMNSAKPRRALLANLRERFPAASIVLRYGLTEMAGPICRLVWHQGQDIPLDSCGVPIDLVDLRIVGPDGVEVDRGQPGEVVVRTAGLMTGYVGQVPHRASAGEYRTGDIGRLDKRGFLYLLGRKDRMIKRGGFRIFPEEIEEAIRGVPGVSECAVSGIPDDRWGERICAWIVPEQHQDRVQLRVMVMTACRAALPHAGTPDLVVFRTALPRTGTEKVQIKRLAAETTARLRHRNVAALPSAESIEEAGCDVGLGPKLYDNTLRDGEQTAGVSFSIEDKVCIAERLIRSGIHQFEAGFAAISPEESSAIRAVLDQTSRHGVRVFGLSRLRQEDVTATLDCGLRHVTVFVPSSDTMIQARLRWNIGEICRRISEVVRFAKAEGLFVKFSCEDSTRTPLRRLVQFYRLAWEAGADYISLPDTVGIAIPEQISNMVKTLKAEIPLPLSIHCHNDLGLAVANSLAAFRAGADEIQVAVNGLGERVGNTALEEFVMAMKVGYGVDMGIDLMEMAGLCDLVGGLSGLRPAAGKPIVGGNAFRHESGIHVQGLLRSDLSTYEPFPPEWLGRQHEVAFGKHSGRSNIRFVCNKFGLTVDEGVEAAALERLETLRKETGGCLSEQQLLDVVRSVQRSELPRVSRSD